MAALLLGRVHEKAGIETGSLDVERRENAFYLEKKNAPSTMKRRV